MKTKIKTKGLNNQNAALKTDKIDRIIELHNLGLSNRTIAKEIEIDKNTVNKYVSLYKGGKLSR
jgi:DNA-binding NarL/FixJ family response regulator